MKIQGLSRRDLLKGGAAAVGSAATLAGCASTAPTTAEPSAAPKVMTSTASPSLARSTTVAPAAADALRRADALLPQMTVEEKAMQLSSVFPLALFGPDGPIRSQLDAQLKHGIGHVSALGLIGHKTPEQLAKSVNASSATWSRRHGSRSPRSSTTRR